MSLTDFSNYRTMSSEEFYLPKPSSRRSFRRNTDAAAPEVFEEKERPENKEQHVGEIEAETSAELEVELGEPEVTDWSHSLLLRISDKDFRDLVCRFFQEKGFMYAEADLGSEEGPDTLLYRPGEKSPYAVMKFQSWCERPIGIKELRGLLGTMTHVGLEHAVFVTTCCFTDSARSFAAENEIGLLDGENFSLQLMNCESYFKESTLKRYAASAGKAPCCPSCGGEMVLMCEAHETMGEVQFYRCLGYPVCRHTLPFPKK